MSKDKNLDNILDEKTIRSYIIKNTAELMNKYYEDNNYNSIDEEYTVDDLDDMSDGIMCNVKHFTVRNHYEFSLENFVNNHFDDLRRSLRRITGNNVMNIFIDDFDEEDSDDFDEEDSDEDEEDSDEDENCSNDYVKIRAKCQDYNNRYYNRYYKLIIEDMYEIEKYTHRLNSDASESDYYVSIDTLLPYLLEQKVTLKTIDDKIISYILNAKDYEYNGQIDEYYIRRDVFLADHEHGYKICLDD